MLTKTLSQLRHDLLDQGRTHSQIWYDIDADTSYRKMLLDFNADALSTLEVIKLCIKEEELDSAVKAVCHAAKMKLNTD